MIGGSSNTDKQPFPDPASATDLADYVRLLDQLRVRCGEPSYRTLARKVGPLLRPPRILAHSTLATVFQPRRRRFDQDLLTGIVRALTADEPTVDRWREAYLRVQRDSKSGGPVGVFRQLPADLPTFTGRQAELKQLLDTATSPPDTGATTVLITAIEGMAGVGKTQLAVHAAHKLVEVGRYLDLQLYVNLRGFDAELPPADPAAVLEAFLRQLGVAAQQIPDDTDERAAMFRERIHGRDALLLLDNAADADQIRDLIPSAPTCLVLVTSRRTLTALDGATPHQLGLFDAQEAVDLLARIAGRDRVAAEPDAALEIVTACALLPLAVALVAARLRTRPLWHLADLLAYLRDNGLDAVSAGKRNLRQVFDLSLRDLPDSSRQMFLLLGMQPGDSLSAEAAAAMVGAPIRQTRHLLESLCDEHLITQPAPGRYGLHDLLRAYANDHDVAALPPGQTSRALQRLITWYLLTAIEANNRMDLKITPVTVDDTHGVQGRPFTTSEEALDWFDAEYANLVAAVHDAADRGWHDIAWRLAVSLHGHFRLRNHLQQGAGMYELALESARTLNDDHGQSRVLNVLGQAYRAHYRLDDAEICYTQAIELAQQSTSPESVWREVVALNNLAVVYNDQGRYDNARTVLDRALHICPEDRRTLLEGNVLTNIAAAYDLQGKLDEAIQTYRRAIAVHQRSGNRMSEIVNWHDIGDSARRLKNYQTALEGFETALRISLEINSLPYEGLGRLGIGDIMSLTGNPTEARQAWSEAYAVLHHIGHAEADTAKERLERTEPLDS